MKWLAAFGLALILAPASAQAAVELFTTEFGPSLSFAAFDPALGSLNSATLKLNLTVFDDFIVANTTGGPQDFTLADLVFASITAPDGSTYVEDTATPVIPLTSVFAFDMFDIHTPIVLTAVDAHPDLASFSSATAAKVSYSADVAEQFGPQRVLGLQIVPLGDFFLGNATLTYDYSPSIAAVPEPSAWALMVMGFAALGAGLRRARRVIALS